VDKILLINKLNKLHNDVLSFDIKQINFFQYYINAAITFVIHVFSENSRWINIINNIKWFLPSFTQNTPHKDRLLMFTHGKLEFLQIIVSIINELQFYYPSDINLNNDINMNNNNIFIVYGHNDIIKHVVACFISHLNLNPILLDEQANLSQTIIEKFEFFSKIVSFAIIILSADDKISDHIYRARQNVILELGYFIAKLGRKNVIVLYDKSNINISVELPTDIDGLLYIKYDNPNGEWRFNICKELQKANFNIDLNLLTV
jgi:predicted nucleotide-binding protein